jgi:hypothetical protein
MQDEQAQLNRALRSALLVATIEQVRELLAQGADLNAPLANNDNTIFAEFSVFHPRKELYPILFAAGADPNVRWISPPIFEGFTMLSYALSRSDSDLGLIELFLQYGADPTLILPSSLTVAQDGIMSIRAKIQACKRALRNRQPGNWSPENEDRLKARIAEYQKIVDLLNDPQKMRAVFMRTDNPQFPTWRRRNANIFDALMNRELGKLVRRSLPSLNGPE